MRRGQTVPALMILNMDHLDGKAGTALFSGADRLVFIPYGSVCDRASDSKIPSGPDYFRCK